jgi:dephospho-CoA kinase
MASQQAPGIEALIHLIETVHRLRAPGGCPWDRAQSHQSLRQYLVEETYEVLDIIDQIHTAEDLKKESIRAPFQEELGDLLMQVLLHSEMAREEGAFSIYDVAKGLDDKLIRRHPHVFGEVKADSAETALQRWEKEKAKEKASQIDASILDGVPRGLPALQKASRVIEKVTKVGFQWSDLEGPLQKVEEELQELKYEILSLERNQDPSQKDQIRKKIEGELGDLLFSLGNLGYLMKTNPETALRGTISRFESRFRHVERRLKEQGKTPEQSDLKEMDQYWNEAKLIERVQVWGLTGGIASGKSTAGSYFSEVGIPVIDADLIAKELTTPQGLAYSSILARFGTADRNQLREIVFSDPQAKEDLESILHPLIRSESQKRITALAQKHPIIIYEASLLIETGRYKDLTGLIVVTAPEDVRIHRLQERSQISPEMAQSILRTQVSDEIRKQHATHVIDNSGSLESLRKQIGDLISNKNWIS